MAHLPPTASFLLLQTLFTESSHQVQLLASPPFSGGVSCQLAIFAGFIYCANFKQVISPFLSHHINVSDSYKVLYYSISLPQNNFCSIYF
jgi:hypothetical protein